MQSRARHSDEAMIELLQHIAFVRSNLTLVATKLLERGTSHDLSKFDPEEFERLVDLRVYQEKHGKAAFGTPGYEEQKKILGPMLEHHYKNNFHHPEHHEHGVAGMTLFDLVEMICDWRAASFREEDAFPVLNLEFLCKKYGIPPMLAAIIANTADDLGWPHNIDLSETVNVHSDKLEEVVSVAEAARSCLLQTRVTDDPNTAFAPVVSITIHLRDRLYALFYSGTPVRRLGWRPDKYDDILRQIDTMKAYDECLVVAGEKETKVFLGYPSPHCLKKVLAYREAHKNALVGLVHIQMMDPSRRAGVVTVMPEPLGI